jgi:hypothetical protein
MPAVTPAYVKNMFRRGSAYTLWLRTTNHGYLPPLHLTHTKIVYIIEVMFERATCGYDSEHLIPGRPVGGYR